MSRCRRRSRAFWTGPQRLATESLASPCQAKSCISASWPAGAIHELSDRRLPSRGPILYQEDFVGGSCPTCQGCRAADCLVSILAPENCSRSWVDQPKPSRPLRSCRFYFLSSIPAHELLEPVREAVKAEIRRCHYEAAERQARGRVSCWWSPAARCARSRPWIRPAPRQLPGSGPGFRARSIA